MDVLQKFKRGIIKVAETHTNLFKWFQALT